MLILSVQVAHHATSDTPPHYGADHALALESLAQIQAEIQPRYSRDSAEI